MTACQLDSAGGKDQEASRSSTGCLPAPKYQPRRPLRRRGHIEVCDGPRFRQITSCASPRWLSNVALRSRQPAHPKDATTGSCSSCLLPPTKVPLSGGLGKVNAELHAYLLPKSLQLRPHLPGSMSMSRPPPQRKPTAEP